MEMTYLIIVGVLFVFAVFDLVVGVSNDAVNFLNSAIGSKAGSRKKIFLIASLGILAGALFSSGMMEVARKGIFHPEFFSFAEIMVIFLAVMLSDVVLLDMYNTLKLPTSTTVSIVFELLGAAVAVSLIKIVNAGDGLGVIWQYINSDKAIEIISGILLSVVISFLAGAIIQYIVRFFFTFEFVKKLKRYGPIWGGIAITAISYFLLIKGVKGSSLLSGDQVDWIHTHTNTLLGMMFVGWSIVLALLSRFAKVNILKVIVLVGTFALAMAFAGNDLVNFIGVPMAGFSSYLLYLQNGMGDPASFLMGGLSGKVPTPFYFLLAAGAVMVATLRYSKKAKSVTETEIGLGRDSVGYENFEASYISRILVGSALQTKTFFSRFVPNYLVRNIQERFRKPVVGYKNDAPAFDLIRASVNLTVASVLIAIATSMKLPLSTTYVTFMVAMGASLADGVRGRDSAVYRITGVLTVIGGWFLTALCAFVLAGLVALIIYVSDIVIVGLLVLGVLFLIYKTHIHHSRTSAKKKMVTDLYNFSDVDLLSKSSVVAKQTLEKGSELLDSLMHNSGRGLEKGLYKNVESSDDLDQYTKILKTTIHDTFASLKKEDVDDGHYYIKVIMYLRKLSSSLQNMADAAYTYVVNHHPSLSKDQVDELDSLGERISAFTNKVIGLLETKNLDIYKEIVDEHEVISLEVDVIKQKQLYRIKHGELGVRNTTLYLTLLVEMQNILVYYVKLLKSYLRLHDVK